MPSLSSNGGPSPSTGSSSNSKGYNNRRAFIILGAIFLSSVLIMVVIYLRFPNMDPLEKQYIKVPQDIGDAKNLGRVLSRYKDKYFYQVLLGYFIVYIFLQSFAIPGSIFLSILSGFLFSFPLALFLVCLCSAIGASFCYLIADFVGHKWVEKYWPTRVADWQAQVASYREHLLNYIIFLRITPFLPNWFINIAAPVINVPLKQFFLGTFIVDLSNNVLVYLVKCPLDYFISYKKFDKWLSNFLLSSFSLSLFLLPLSLPSPSLSSFSLSLFLLPVSLPSPCLSSFSLSLFLLPVSLPSPCLSSFSLSLSLFLLPVSL
ncbi:Transmembrane protein 41 homolog,Transmembrane protein 41B [Acanthosepion pharaonis]|uniref:Transmembrane protein 41 homolog,Transmembrane protein 41B n=1 Tax=Acanthosepion pharaonis TaxID=158019 RepID=A0A812CL07_ACAPH|nr:Transmembrane protein 41 homolog,Transmembrane protein 41B [Sepia pharaonis]